MVEDFANHEGQFFQLAVVAQFGASIDERAHLAARHPRAEGGVHHALALAGLAVGVDKSGRESHDRRRRRQQRGKIEAEQRRKRRQGKHLGQGQERNEDLEHRTVDVDGRPGDPQGQRDKGEMLNPRVVQP